MVKRRPFVLEPIFEADLAFSRVVNSQLHGAWMVSDTLTVSSAPLGPLPEARKLRRFGAIGWWSEMDSNQRYLSPDCLPRSQRLPYHQIRPQ